MPSKKKLHAAKTNDFSKSLCGLQGSRKVNSFSLDWDWFRHRRRWENGWKPLKGDTCKTCRAIIKAERSK